MADVRVDPLYCTDCHTKWTEACLQPRSLPVHRLSGPADVHAPTYAAPGALRARPLAAAL